jgi:methyl-accepting chemotaxis protein
VDKLDVDVLQAAKQQSQGFTQINTAIGQMDKVTQTNAASAEESAAAAEELSAQVITMKESVTALLQLVVGNRQSDVTTSTAPAFSPKKTAASPAAKRPALKNGKGTLRAAASRAPLKNGRGESSATRGLKDF